MTEQDRVYYARRAQEEWDLAQTASDPKVAAAHRAMSKAYLEKASVGDRALPEPPELVG